MVHPLKNRVFYFAIIFIVTSCLFLLSKTVAAQTSDDQFKEPLKEVIREIETRFGITIRYSDDLVDNKWVTYAQWRYRPALKSTLINVLSSQDLTFTKEADKKYKLQPYQYHLKTVEEGKEQMEALSKLYNDQKSWELRRDSLRKCFLHALKLTRIPSLASFTPILTAIRNLKEYSVQNFAIETLPGLYVCGSIYRPLVPKGKLALILNPDGHFSRGRYREDCQYRCAMEAKMGAIACSYDLFGWEGESILQIDPKDHRHSIVQSIQVLNTKRILDYLLSLADADPKRVAITGASGGGSQTMLMTAIEERITLSVPVAMLSSYHSGGCPCESGMGVHLCGGGTNNVEIASMAAPRPQLVISDGKDWTQHVPENEMPFLKRIYGFYNRQDLVQNVHLSSEGHDYGISKRKAMYAFIAQQFNLSTSKVKNNKGEFDESGVVIEKDNALKTFGANGELLPRNAIKGFQDISRLFQTYFN